MKALRIHNPNIILKDITVTGDIPEVDHVDIYFDTTFRPTIAIIHFKIDVDEYKPLIVDYQKVSHVLGRYEWLE